MTVRSYSALSPRRSPPLPPFQVPLTLRGRLGESLRIDDCYCPIPDCSCQRAVLRLWTTDGRPVASIDVALHPPGPGEPYEQLELEPGMGQGLEADDVLAGCWESLGALHALAGDRLEAERCLRHGIEAHPELSGCAAGRGAGPTRRTGGGPARRDPGGGDSNFGPRRDQPLPPREYGITVLRHEDHNRDPG